MVADELWRTVDHIGNGNYEVSTHGSIRRKSTQRQLAIRRNTSGVMSVNLMSDGKQSLVTIGRLVLTVFSGPPGDTLNTVLYIDGDRSNNAIWNLQWATRSDAMARHRHIERMNKLEQDRVRKEVRQNYGPSKYLPLGRFEEWRDISVFGYGEYEVSSFGNVRITGSDHIRSLQHREDGSVYVSLTVDGEQKSVSVGRLVLTAFKGVPVGRKNTVLYKDGRLKNNDISNLEWSTRTAAIAYHKDFEKFNAIVGANQRPVIETKSGERFDNIVKASGRFGIPPTEIFWRCKGIHDDSYPDRREDFTFQS